jgi:hypothetical protein
MLRRTLVAALVVLAAGCPRSREAAPDLARIEVARAEPLTCRALQGCTDACADAACAEACVRRLTAAARPAYDALEACVVPACADADAGSAPCRVPGAFACKMCVLSRCASQASSCMTH